MKINRINRMYILSFLFTLHISLSAYVNSIFLTKYFSVDYVGLIYTISAVITLILLSQSSFVLKHFGNRKLVLWLLIINTLSLGGVLIFSNPLIIALVFVSMFVTNTLFFFSLDIFIQHFGNPETIGRTRSLYLTIGNTAWLISPLITSVLITQNGDGYMGLYLTAFILSIVTIVGFLFLVRKFDDKKYTRTPFIETYKYLKTNKHMLAVTIIDFILEFFYLWMVVYVPIYLHSHLGISWEDLGVIFTIMLVPFVIFEFPVGILIDKYHVKKRLLLKIGFIIMAISTFLIACFTTTNIVIWALILFGTRTGASIVESTTEIYFFTHVTEEDAFLLSIFRDMSPVAYIIAPLVATMFFVFLPFRYLFIVLSIIIMVAFYYIGHLKHNHAPDAIYSLPNTD